jgi:hypothetical protein
MKTYFISGRTNNQQCDTSVASDTVTATRNAPPDAGGLRSQLSFRKVKVTILSHLIKHLLAEIGK